MQESLGTHNENENCERQRNVRKIKFPPQRKYEFVVPAICQKSRTPLRPAAKMRMLSASETSEKQNPRGTLSENANSACPQTAQKPVNRVEFQSKTQIRYARKHLQSQKKRIESPLKTQIRYARKQVGNQQTLERTLLKTRIRYARKQLESQKTL